MPHPIPTRAAARANNGEAHADAPDIDPQDRIDLVLAHLGTRTEGLTGREAQRRLDQFGPNEITRTQKSSRLRELARQLAHPLAWLRLGALVALLVTGGYFLVLLTAGWSLGDPTGAGTPLHHAYLQATTMTWAGIVACQMGAAFAVRTSRASLREVGVFSNPHLLRGVAFALLFAAAIIYLPPLQSIFHTAALGPRELIVLACFPFIVWGSDELWRWRARRLGATEVRHPEPAPAGAL